MSLSPHTLVPRSGSRVRKTRIGRGLGSGRGKTGGRGTKGQRSRSGGRSSLKLKGMKQMLLSFPKNRGFQSYTRKPASITLKQLQSLPEGSVTLDALRAAGLLKRIDAAAKVVGRGVCAKKYALGKGIMTSAGARKSIEAAGGTVADVRG